MQIQHASEATTVRRTAMVQVAMDSPQREA